MSLSLRLAAKLLIKLSNRKKKKRRKKFTQRFVCDLSSAETEKADCVLLLPLLIANVLAFATSLAKA